MVVTGAKDIEPRAVMIDVPRPGLSACIHFRDLMDKVVNTENTFFVDVTFTNSRS